MRLYIFRRHRSAGLAAYVADNYSVTGINEISRDNRGYEVELNTGVELIFDRDGKFVRIDR